MKMQFESGAISHACALVASAALISAFSSVGTQQGASGPDAVREFVSSGGFDTVKFMAEVAPHRKSTEVCLLSNNSVSPMASTWRIVTAKDSALDREFNEWTYTGRYASLYYQGVVVTFIDQALPCPAKIIFKSGTHWNVNAWGRIERSFGI